MSRQITKMKNRSGLAPGTLLHIGSQKTTDTDISSFNYNLDVLQETALNSEKDIMPFFSSDTVSWINITGLHDVELFSKLGDLLKIHPLILEDILDTSQKPKMDIYEKHLFILLKMISWDNIAKSIKFEQVSFLIFDNCLISFQEIKGDVFDKVRQRLRNKNSRIRRLGVDYLLYSLLDAIVDNYFLLLFNLGEEIENMEDSLINTPEKDILANIYSTKRDILALRKSTWHLRPVITNLYQDDFKIITPEVSRFLKDLQDNTSQVIDTIETYRENISGLVDIHLSNTNNRMNQIMKVLTIFAAIFIPLTFVAGVYGMNFKYMPELSQKWAYTVWWLVSILITASMLIFFKKKKWL